LPPITKGTCLKNRGRWKHDRRSSDDDNSSNDSNRRDLLSIRDGRREGIVDLLLSRGLGGIWGHRVGIRDFGGK